MDTTLRKIKAIIGVALLAAVAGAGAALLGVDYEVAFGPAVGSIVSASVGYAVKESLPRIKKYIESGLGT